MLLYCKITPLRVVVDQLVERRVRNAKVGSSILLHSTTISLGVTPLRFVAAALQRMVDKIDPQAGRYRMLFESSPLPMWVLDDQTLRFLAVNDAAVCLYGYTREEFLAMTALDIDKEISAVSRGVFHHRKKGGEPVDVDGVGHLVSWRGRP